MIEKDLLLPTLDEPLVDHAIEERIKRRLVVIAAHEAHIPACDTIPISFRLFERTETKVSEDPEDVIFPHPIVDRINQCRIVALYRLGRHSPTSPPIRSSPLFFLVG